MLHLSVVLFLLNYGTVRTPKMFCTPGLGDDGKTSCVDVLRFLVSAFHEFDGLLNCSRCGRAMGVSSL